MIYFASRSLGLVLVTVLAAACVSVAPQDGREKVKALIQSSGVPLAGIDLPQEQALVDARTRELLTAPVTARAAIELSYLHNPHLTSEFARLKVRQSDLIAASRVQNPVFSASRTNGGGSHISIFGISQNLSSLILLSARKRFAAGAYAGAQASAAASIINLSADVEQAWLAYVGAEQVAAMRSIIASSTETSSELAERFYAAGNIDELDLALAHSAAAQARISATRAAAEALRAKFALHQLMGLTGEPAWIATLKLPAPIATNDALDELLATAHTRRGDLAAARQEVALLDDALHLAKRWRWLGKIDVGIERDREQDGVNLTGPTLSLALPIFDQGEAGIGRAEGQLTDARARLSALEAQIDHDVRFNHARVNAARAIAEQFVNYLNPAQDMIVKRQQQRENFMLIGQFELLLARQQQYDAYQSYLEAVRDYWMARGELARATGGGLPSDAQVPPANIGVDSVIKPAEEPMDDMPGMTGMDHSAHHSLGEIPSADFSPPKPSTPHEHTHPKEEPSGPGNKR